MIRTDCYAWLTILLMGLVTWSTRVAGVSFARWVPDTPFWQRFLQTLPQALLIAICVPFFLSGNLVNTIGAILTLLVASLKVNLVIVMMIGMAAVALMRQLMV